LLLVVVLGGTLVAQDGGTPRKRLLVVGDEKGYRHEAITRAMVTVERLGRESGLWETVIRTDTEVLTKRKLEYNARTLNDFDAVLFYTGGALAMDEQQKADLLSFVHDEGKGFVGVHSAAITFTKWPEYGEMLGGFFDEHPWGTFEAPILVEDVDFVSDSVAQLASAGRGRVSCRSGRSVRS
jgi:type 1 glutamine amidotransferase